MQFYELRISEYVKGTGLSDPYTEITVTASNLLDTEINLLNRSENCLISILAFINFSSNMIRAQSQCVNFQIYHQMPLQMSTFKFHKNLK